MRIHPQKSIVPAICMIHVPTFQNIVDENCQMQFEDQKNYWIMGLHNKLYKDRDMYYAIFFINQNCNLKTTTTVIWLLNYIFIKKVRMPESGMKIFEFVMNMIFRIYCKSNAVSMYICTLRCLFCYIYSNGSPKLHHTYII
jgi:hypothetical protein